MNTLEVNQYFYNYPQFSGTYARDRLPMNITFNSGVVINTDKASMPGEHWVAVYLKSNGCAEYFDSYGLPPLRKEIVQFLDRISPNGYFQNTIDFQSLNTDTCGMYCVYYLANRFNGGDYNLFRSIFNYKPNLNDRLAKILYKGIKL